MIGEYGKDTPKYDPDLNSFFNFLLSSIFSIDIFSIAWFAPLASRLSLPYGHFFTHLIYFFKD